MKFFIVLSFIWCLCTQAELLQKTIAERLHIPQDLVARLVARITYIDHLNIEHASYYPILCNEFLKPRGYKKGCEIGIFTAGHAAFMLANSSIEKLYCIDPYRGPDFVTTITDGFEKDHWQLCWETMYYYALDKLSMFGDRAQTIRLPAEKAADMIENESLDFIFIDGDHSYNAVLSDCAHYYDKIRSGGIVSGDDYNIDDVSRALHTFFEQKNLTINIYPNQERFWWVEKP